MNYERYVLTEHGVAIHELYTTTLMSVEEAIRLSKWLNWHYVELDAMYRKVLVEQRQKMQDQKTGEQDGGD